MKRNRHGRAMVLLLPPPLPLAVDVCLSRLEPKSGFAVLCSVNASLNSSHHKRNVIKPECQQLRTDGWQKSSWVGT